MSGYVFNTKADLQTAILSWINTQSTAQATYGDINTWDVTRVTDFNHLFMESVASDFNDDISNWDVSRVTDMSGLLDEAGEFNQVQSISKTCSSRASAPLTRVALLLLRDRICRAGTPRA